MPRRPRFVLPGAAHHITQRGNNRQDVFLADQDRSRYLEILAQHSQRHGLHILAWCLMSNHIHLIAVPDSDHSLALTLGQTHSQYALEQNRRQDRVGHLWQNRFFSCPLDSEHLLTALLYVDLNPVRARMVPQAWDWPWSSAVAHSSANAPAGLLDPHWPDWMDAAGIGWDFDAWRQGLQQGLREDHAVSLRRATRLGEPLGEEAFIAHLERMAGRRLRVWRPGRPRQAAPELALAQGLLFEE